MKGGRPYELELQDESLRETGTFQSQGTSLLPSQGRVPCSYEKNNGTITGNGEKPH